MKQRQKLKELGLDYHKIAEFFSYSSLTFANSTRRELIEKGVLRVVEYTTAYNSTVKKVKEFNRAFDIPILDNSEEAQINRRVLRIKLLFEELQELAVATGCGEDFYNLCKQSRLVKGDRNRVEELDALTDLQYVLDGTYLELGHWKNKDEAFKRVHDSNMSKMCTKIEAEDFVDELTRGKKGCFYDIVEKSNSNCYVIRYDGKIMKPFSYIPPDLKDLV